MRIEILTIFLTTPLSFAIVAFMNLPEHHWYDWAIFTYFVLTSIRFFDGDVRAWARLPLIEKEDVDAHRAASFFIGVASKFMFIVMAFYVGRPTYFFSFYAIALFFDAAWLWILREMISPPKDTDKKPLSDVFRDWLILDMVRAVLLIIIAVAISVNRSNKWVEEGYIILAGILICYVMLILDFTFNAKHYFRKE